MSDSSNGKRNSLRLPMVLRVTLATMDASQFLEVYSANLGKGGVFLRSEKLLEKGSEIRLEITLKDQTEPFLVEGTVVHVRQPDPARPTIPGGMGVRFKSMDPQTEARLKGYLEVEQNKLAAAQAEQAEVSAEEEGVLDLVDELQQPKQQDEAEKNASMLDHVLGGSSKNDRITLPLAFSVNDTVIGIDLGTSNSCVAVVKDGKPVVIAAENGKKTTVPSVVSFTRNGDVLVGRSAKDQLSIDPENTIYGAKRFIGRHYNSPIVHQIKKHFPYTIVQGENGEVAVKCREEMHTLADISAKVLQEIKLMAQEFIELEITKAVITVPAYYNDNQRQAVKEAGQLAGLDVQRIVNEPTAAALAYGFNSGFQQRILVYDLGGGTFDVSVLELMGNSFKVVACGGNNFLGGEDFDNSIVDFIVGTYERQNAVRIAGDAIIRQRIKQAAEHAKCVLSEEETCTVNIPYLKTETGESFNLQMPLTREILNKVTMHIVDHSLKICDEVLGGRGISKEDLDEVIMVGGQTRMPLVRNKIKHHFGVTPHVDINPDEVVALGAAVLGASMDKLDNLTLKDATSISIGIALPGGRFKPVIKANTPVPITKQYSVGAKMTGDDGYSIDVFQGESPNVKDNEYLGTLIFSDQPFDGSDRLKMNIEFTMTEECILKVIVTNPETGNSEEALLMTYDTPPSVKDAAHQAS